jgi:signal transduction histidine kinase/ABC-type phosphate/phosphonate transport system substrate-binding protein
LLLALPTAEAAARDIRVAVLAFRDLETTARQYEPTREALAAQLPQDRLILTPYYLDQMEQVVAKGEADFVFCNPELFALLRSRHGLAAMATLMPMVGGHPTTQFGGVIFAKAQRDDLAELKDLSGKVIATVGKTSLGSYLMQRWTLFEAGVTIDEGRLLTTGMPQDKVVMAVVDGRADVGFVRTGVLEAMERERKVKPGDFKIIHPQTDVDFPQHLSTELYPEWPFAATKHAPMAVVKTVTQTLLSIRPDSAAAKTAGYYGFSPPGDYSPVEAMMLRLHAIPANPDSFGLVDVLRKYSQVLTWTLVAMVLMGFAVTAFLLNLTLRLRRALAEKKRLELSQILLASMGEGVFGLDGEGRTSFINDAALKMLRMSRDEAMQTGLASRFGAAHISELASRELTVSLPDGTGFEANLVVSPIQGDDPGKGLVAIFQDISERKRAEILIREANARLTVQSHRLELSNRDLEQFAYVASHDLRQPLRQIASFVSLIKRRLGDGAGPDLKEFIDYAIEGATRLDRLILDLLEFSRIGRKGGERVRLDMADAVRQAADGLALTIKESGADFGITVAEGLPPVMGRPSELARLAQNLITNAVKYRAENRPAKVAVSLAKSAAGGVELSVKDNGIGIAPEHFERIFGIFQRLNPPGKYEGTGIGLAICKKIVEEHGGTITVASRPGEGSCFTVTLPAAD